MHGEPWLVAYILLARLLRIRYVLKLSSPKWLRNTTIGEIDQNIRGIGIWEGRTPAIRLNFSLAQLNAMCSRYDRGHGMSPKSQMSVGGARECKVQV